MLLFNQLFLLKSVYSTLTLITTLYLFRLHILKNPSISAPRYYPSLNARLNESRIGENMYARKVREPVTINTSAGMPG